MKKTMVFTETYLDEDKNEVVKTTTITTMLGFVVSKTTSTMTKFKPITITFNL